MPARSVLSPSKRFESLHGPYTAFDIPLILFNLVIQLRLLPDINDFFIGFFGVEYSQRRRVGATFIGSVALKRRQVTYRFL